MNYFPFDPDPRKAAIALDDKRLRRIFHEAVMTLSKAQPVIVGTPGPYLQTVPISRGLMDFVTGDGELWFVAWTSNLLTALVERIGMKRVEEYVCYQKYQQLDQRLRTIADPIRMPARFPNFARSPRKGLDYSDWSDTHAAYREYVRQQWDHVDKRSCVWTFHGPPPWAQLGS